MARTPWIALALLVAACGPYDVNDTSLSPEANRIAVDLQGDWTLGIANVCSDGAGQLSVSSTFAWLDDQTQEAGVNGAGTWVCGSENGAFSIVVGVNGKVTLTLHRSIAPGSAPWTGTGLYAPQDMSGAIAPTAGVPCATCSWSAHHR